MYLSLYYFGPIPYFQQLVKEKNIVFDIHEKYNKQTWRNRCVILSANGKLTLSIPVNRPNGKDTLMHEVLISDKEDWRKDHWKSIESAYSHAPYFFFYGEQIKEIIYQDYTYLYEINLAIIAKIKEWLDLMINYSLSRSFLEVDASSTTRFQFEKKELTESQNPYIQVFSDKLPFHPNLSILDLIMNLGPIARNYLTL